MDAAALRREPEGCPESMSPRIKRNASSRADEAELLERTRSQGVFGSLRAYFILDIDLRFSRKFCPI